MYEVLKQIISHKNHLTNCKENLRKTFHIYESTKIQNRNLPIIEDAIGVEFFEIIINNKLRLVFMDALYPK